MSISDQQRMKGQGNQVSNVSKDHIESGEDFESWRHQPANHGPYVSMSTANDPYNSGYYGSTAGGQFQYPQFGVGDGTWSSGNNENLAILGSYAQTHDNYGVDGMFGPTFGQPSTYNYFPGNGDYNTWGGSQQVNAAAQQSRKGLHYDDYYRGDPVYPAHDGLKAVEQGMQGLGLEVSSTLQQEKDLSSNTNTSSNTTSSVAISKHDQPKEIVPKKMTWASIASQPAKPQTTSTTSTVKKKGPGMPPPPMVPGKHNMDIGTWDTPSKNGHSMMVPPPLPPPIITAPPPPVPIIINQNNKTNSVITAPPPTLVQQQPQQQAPPPPTTSLASTPSPIVASSGVQQHQPQQQQQHQPTHNMGRHQQQHQQQNIGNSQMNMRPSWSHDRGSYSQNNQNMLQQPPPPQQHQRTMAPGGPGNNYQGLPPLHMQQSNQPQQQQRMLQSPVSNCSSSSSHIILDTLKDKNNYNPDELDLDKLNFARFFVIKSYSEDDIHRSIKYEIWCSTEHGNKRLDQAFKEREKESGLIYLLFSVNGSGHFCGVAQMISSVDYNSNSTVWSQNKWKGTFKVKWIYVKDVPNINLRYIRLENNENKSVTNSRDTQEVLNAKGLQVMRIVHSYKHTTSIFDDFIHYEKRQELEDSRKVESLPPQQQGPRSMGGGSGSNNFNDKYNNEMKSHGGGYDKNNHHGGRDGRDGRDGGSSYEKHSYGGGGGGGKSYGYDNKHQQYNHHGSSDRGGGGGGYHNYDNRREDRGSYDRGLKDHHDGGGGTGSGYYPRDDYPRNNRGGSGGNRGDYRDNRRDDRGYNNNNRDRDRDNHHDNGGYNSRGGGESGGVGGGRGGGDRGGGGNRDHHRGERGDHHGGRAGGNGGSVGGRGRGNRN